MVIAGVPFPISEWIDQIVMARHYRLITLWWWHDLSASQSTYFLFQTGKFLANNLNQVRNTSLQNSQISRLQNFSRSETRSTRLNYVIVWLDWIGLVYTFNVTEHGNESLNQLLRDKRDSSHLKVVGKKKIWSIWIIEASKCSLILLFATSIGSNT